MPNLHEKLTEENRRLRALVDAFTQINHTLDLDTVLENSLRTATRLMQAETGSIALINEERTHLHFLKSTDKNFDQLRKLSVPLGEGISGRVALNGTSERIEDVQNDKRFYNKVDESMGKQTRSYICVPLIARDKIIGTAQIMNRTDGKVFSKSDLTLLEGFARQAALAIYNAQMHEVMLEQRALESELELCAQIQTALFPARAPEVSGYQVLGASRPCKQVGGDYFTYIRRPDGTTDLLLADVSGKGLSAALMVSELHTGIHLLSQMDAGLGECIARLDEHLRSTLILGKFITLFAMRLPADGNKSDIEYVLSGHPSPLIAHPGGTLRELERTSLAIGIPNAPPITSGTFSMQDGEVLLAFSDGYSEVINESGEMYDDIRIGKLLAGRCENKLDEIISLLDEDVRIFGKNAADTDDATLLLVRKMPPHQR